MPDPKENAVTNRETNNTIAKGLLDYIDAVSMEQAVKILFHSNPSEFWEALKRVTGATTIRLDWER